MMDNISRLLQFIVNPKRFLKREFDMRLDNILEKNFMLPIVEALENDIFVVGFPKSGNTWMQSIIAGVLYGIDTEYLSDKLAQEIVPDVHARSYYKRFGSLCFFKSHALPNPLYRRVIYIVRDGRDAMTSYFHYNKRINQPYSIEEMVREGKGIFPSKWHVHVSAWLENPFDAEIMFIRYEDLLIQPVYEIERICKFSCLNREQELVERVAKGNSFERMQQKAEKFGGLGHKNWEGEKGKQFFRKGKRGDYKNLFSDELCDYFDSEAHAELNHFHYL